MDINPAALTAFFQGVDATWSNAYAQAEVWIDKVATTKNSKTSAELYSWQAIMPTLREWLGPRIVNPMAAYLTSGINKVFEDTIGINVDQYEDDQFGVFENSVRLLAMRSAKWPDYTMVPYIQGGDGSVQGINGQCYDGQNFFSTSHPINLYDPSVKVGSSTTQSNLLANMPLTPDNMATAIQTMMTWVDEGGQPYGTEAKLLVIPPQLKYTAMNILNAAFIAPGAVGGNTQVGANANVLKGIVDLLVIPELGAGKNADATSWYLLDTGKPVKPFVWQLRKAPILTPRVSPTDPAVFDLNQFLWGVKARGVPVYALWWLAAKMTA